MADTLIGSNVSVSDLNDMCPRAKQYALGTAINAALAQLGIAASDTTIAIGDGTDTVTVGITGATGTPTITLNGDTDACTVNIATVAGHTTNIGTGDGATNIGGTASGAVTIRSNGAIAVGNAEANSLTLSGGAGLASLDGTTVAVGPATTSTIAIGSASAGAVTVSSNSTITIGNAACDGVKLDVSNLGVQIGATATVALALGGGTSVTPLTSASTSKNFVGFWTQSTDATGTDMRGMYFRHYLAGAGGAQSGEAIRAFCTVSASAANAARGIHSSLSFGTSGDIAGLGAAVDATLHVPNGNLGGTTAAVNTSLYADGASSNNTGTMSLFRGVIDGETSGKAALQDAYFLNLSGLTISNGNMIETNTSTATHSLKCIIDGTIYYMLLSTSA